MVCTTSAAVATTGVIDRTVRACDSCIGRRARWYCAADDAFLCQNCDSSVHSANPLARRHDRVRLQTNSMSKPIMLAPTWHHGFKRKARTPRPSKAKIGASISPLVPEMETCPEEGSTEEEQLLYRVPIFDPATANACKSKVKPTVQSRDNANTSNSSTVANGNELLAGFLQADAELAEFAADMESLLGRGLKNDSFSTEELGLVDDKFTTSSIEESEQVKEELDNVEEPVKVYEEIDLSRETLEINFDCRCTDEEQEEAAAMAAAASMEKADDKRKIGLRLNYEAIAVEWSAGGTSSPWMDGERPQLGPDDCWLDYMGMWGGAEVQGLVQGEKAIGHFDEGREARVSRYREKRRKRLFSKKIRYEVRKLNAEKRPRMKGRFVKRASFAAAAAAAAASSGTTAFKHGIS